MMTSGDGGVWRFAVPQAITISIPQEITTNIPHINTTSIPKTITTSIPQTTSIAQIITTTTRYLSIPPNKLIQLQRLNMLHLFSLLQ